jgi:hypothetical protein
MYVIHNVLDIKLIFLKHWIFTNLNTAFPVLVLVCDFEREFSEGVLHGHSNLGCDSKEWIRVERKQKGWLYSMIEKGDLLIPIVYLYLNEWRFTIIANE